MNDNQISTEQVFRQVNAAMAVLKKLTAKEKEKLPSKMMAENYNELLALAKEAMPEVNARLWPKPVKIEPAMGGHVNIRIAEFQVFYSQMSAILEEGVEPTGMQIG